MKIGFIGGGNMAGAMITALLNSKYKSKNEIIVYAKSKNQDISQKFGVCVVGSEIEVINCADIIILAIKPKDYSSVLNLIKDKLNDKIIVSVAPKFSIDELTDMLFKGAKIVRSMPNTPASVGAATSAVCFCESLSVGEREIVFEIFRSFGEVFEIKESEFAAFVGIAGSLPAYVFIFIEALADAGVLNGMSRKMAYDIATNAVLGSAKMALMSKKHPAELKDEVCSPAGTTIQAIAELEKNGFRSAIIQAVNACVNKAR